MNDRQHLMPQDDYMDPRAQELAGHLSVLGDIDFWVTPDHVAKRFHELLDKIGTEDPSGARAEGMRGRSAGPAGRPPRLAAREAAAGQDAGSLAR